MSNPHKIINNITNEIGVKELQTLQVQNLQSLLNSSIESPYALNADQYDLALELFKPRLIKFKKYVSHVSHPIAALLNNYANRSCIEEGKRFKTCIDIGGSPMRTPQNTHMCVLINDVKTDARYVESAFNQLNIDKNVNYDFTSYLSEKHAHCVTGAENCFYKADYAYAVNVYDISFDTIIKIFTNHNLLVLDMWLFLPVSLIDKYFDSDRKIYRVRHEKDGKSKFDLLDNSDIYVHNTANWKKYLTYTIIKCANFSISIEHKEQIGTFTKLRFVRTENLNGEKYRMLCLKKLIKEVAVPDLIYYYTIGNAAIDYFTKYIMVSTNYVEKLMNWSTSVKDHTWDYNSFAVYATQIKTDIKYTSANDVITVYEGISPEFKEFERLKQSLFIIVSIDRFLRTKNISSIYKFIKNNSCTPDETLKKLWVEFKQTLRLIKNELPLVGYIENTSDEVISVRNHHIMDVYVKYCEDHEVSDVHYSQISACFKKKYKMQKKCPFLPPEENIIPKTKDENNVNLVNKIKDTDCGIYCENVIFNPKGDGSCGIHALRYLCKDLIYFEDMQYVERDGKVRTMSKTFHSDMDMYAIAHYNKFDLAIHQDGILITYSEEFTKRYSINIALNHWTVLGCNHLKIPKMQEPIKRYVGDYRDIKKDVNCIYINCANEMLTDGAGQAKAFKNLFPNYSKDIKKPIPNVLKVKITEKGKNYDCYLLVAYNNIDKSHEKVIKRYHEIFKIISKEKKKIYLPLIGTALYKNDLCCFKTCLEQYKFDYTLCFLNEKQMQNFDDTRSCVHGGYTPLNDALSHVVVLNDEIVEDGTYETISPQYPKDHARRKLLDILKVVADNGRGNQINNIYDLAAAPGYFYKEWVEFEKTKKGIFSTTQYHKYHYTGEKCSYLMSGLTADKKYKKLENLIKDHAEFRDDLIIFDNHINPSQLTAIMGKMSYNSVLITKTNPFAINPAVILDVATDLGYSQLLFRNDFSPPKSMEMFVMFRQVPNEKVVELSRNTLVNKIVDIVKENDVKSVCNHIPNYGITNCDITFSIKKESCVYYNQNLAESLKFINSDIIYEHSIEDDINFTIKTLDGVAGCKKTSSILRETCCACTTIVTPYKVVADDIRLQKAKGITFIKFFEMMYKKERCTKFVVLDELLSYSAYYIHMLLKFIPKDVTVIGLTDSKQITYRNYAGTQEEYVIQYKRPYILETYRMPHNICKLFNNYIPGIHTNSNIAGVIEHFDDVDEIAKDMDGKEVILTFTEKSRDALRTKYPDKKGSIITVNASQGITTNTVRLYLNDMQEIRHDLVRYIYVAASRATTRFVTYGNTCNREQYFEILGTNIERILDAFDIIPHNEVIIEKEKPLKKHTTVTTGSLQPISLNMIDDILQHIYPSENDSYCDIIGYKSCVLPEVKSKKAFKGTFDYFSAENTTISGKRIANRRFLAYYHTKNKIQTVECMIKRYAKEGKHIPKDFVKKYIQGLDKFMKEDWKDAMRKEVTTTDMFKYVCDYLIKLQTKFPELKEAAEFFSDDSIDDENNNMVWLDAMLCVNPDIKYNKETFAKFHADHKFDIAKNEFSRRTFELLKYFVASNMNKVKDLQEPWTSSYHNLIQFHLKSQPKEIRKPGFDVEYKAGQGVSAWSKLMNVLFSSFTRAYSDMIGKYVKNNVQLSYGQSDTKLQEFFKKYPSQLNSVNHKKLMVDFSEFDSSQEEKGILSSAILLKSLGFKTEVIDFYMKMRKSWTLLANSSSGASKFIIRLEGDWMQHSGQPFTLDGNTLFNMSAIGMCYDIKEMQFAAFKGDDSVICAEKIVECKLGSDTHISICGYKLKTNYASIPEYIANIITPTGNFFPDVLRRITRVLNKIYSDEVDWEETRKAITDCLDVVETNEDLNDGYITASKFYAQFGILVTPEEIELITLCLYALKETENLEEIRSKKYVYLSL